LDDANNANVNERIEKGGEEESKRRKSRVVVVVIGAMQKPKERQRQSAESNAQVKCQKTINTMSSSQPASDISLAKYM
jgi:malate/lactate dehydrogenase